MAVNNQLGQTEDFSTEMEGVAETRLLAFLSRQSFDGFQVEIVVEMEIVKVFPVNQQVQHVVSLSTDL